MYDLRLDNAVILDRYVIRHRLRSGNYTELFVGLDRRDNQTVIVKALNVALRGTPDQALERKLLGYFQTEMEVLRLLQHPHIIRLLEHGEAEDNEGRSFQFLVLEYMAGGDLMTLSRQAPLPLPLALHLTHQICQGLSFAHSHGIIHRDVKPQNILLNSGHRSVKITDFGIAKVRRGDDDDITRGIGTETYAAPECYDFEESQTDLTPSADVYGLAKTVYVMVTAEAPRAFFQRPISHLPPPIAAEPGGPELERILRRATQHDPADRYSGIEAFWADLAELIPTAGDVTEAERIGRAEPSESLVSIQTGGPLPHRGPNPADRLEVPLSVTQVQTLDEATVMAPPRPRRGAGEEMTARVERRQGAWTRRLFTAGLASVFIASTFWVHAIFSGGWVQLEGVVTAVNLNLRTSPHASSSSLGWIQEGMPVKIIGLSKDGQWFEVESRYWNGREWRRGQGWVSRAYVDLQGRKGR